MYSSTLCLTPALGLVNASSRAHYHREKVPFYSMLGEYPGSVYTGTENLAPTGIRSPERPAHSESLDPLWYPGPPFETVQL
jgi:hypothetical protein